MIEIATKSMFFFVAKAVVKAWQVSLCGPTILIAVKALRWHPELTHYIRNIRIFLALNYANSILDLCLDILIYIRHSGVNKMSIEIELRGRFFVGCLFCLTDQHPLRTGAPIQRRNKQLILVCTHPLKINNCLPSYLLNIFIWNMYGYYIKYLHDCKRYNRQMIKY